MMPEDPYLYNIEMLRHRRSQRLEQLEMFPHLKFPPVKEDVPESVPRRKAKAGVARVRKVRSRRKPP